MTPRAYTMDKRAAATEETRRRILQASLKLHSENGFTATSWDDIAREAGVAVGTVYNHFPTFDDLVPACSGFGMQLNPPPTSEIFVGARGKKQRVEWLVRELFAFYERGRKPMSHTFAERGVVPAIARLTDELMMRARALVEEALGSGTPEEVVTVAEALVDFRVWEAMYERSLDREVIADTIASCIQRISSSSLQG